MRTLTPIDFLVLGVLSLSEGIEASEVQEKIDRGIFDTFVATLRLEKEGFLQADKKGFRRFYRLTQAGLDLRESPKAVVTP